jgi:hypothetical protein
MQRGSAKRLSFFKQHSAELGLAKPNRVLQYGSEDWL